MNQPDPAERDVDWREREFQQREEHHRQQISQVRRTGIFTLVGLAISALAVSLTFVHQERQARAADEEFRESLSRDEYGQIVTGLSSSSVAVQDSSMRRLIAYVRKPSNYPNRAARRDGYNNAIHTLTAFIADESLLPGHVGLSHYQSPQPLIVPRAMRHLRELTSDRLGAVTVEISRADLHGASLENYRPRAHLLAVGADFRRASLEGLNLTASQNRSQLNSAFFTCADLSGARLGAANMAGADLTGANLSGADLSRVTGLDRDQINGVTVDRKTRLPEGLPDKPRTGWIGTERCYELVNNMTGMRGAQGYASTLPCPTTEDESRAMELEPPWQGELKDLVLACRLRSGLETKG